MTQRARIRPTIADTVVYKLIGITGITLYIGITNDPIDREQQHQSRGLIFNELVQISDPMIRQQAYERETMELLAYYNAYGDLPLYNRNEQTYRRIGVGSQNKLFIR